MKPLIAALIILVFLGCQESKPQDVPDEIRPIPASNSSESLLGVKLYINKRHIKLLSQPSTDGETIQDLTLGERLFHTGKISEHTTAIRLQGKDYDEPWLEVQSSKGKKGWVYAAAIEFDAENEQSLQIALTTIRLQRLFGQQLTKAIYDYQRDFKGIRTAAHFERAFLNGEQLRDQLLTKLQLRSDHGDSTTPDLFWLNDYLPGFVLQLVDGGNAYHIYADYKTWQRKALSTPEPIDNQFTDLCLFINPSDGIEYDFKAWFIQTWEHGGSSLLGKGTHVKAFHLIDSLQNESPLFTSFYKKTKQALLNDIIEPSNSYWESSDNIITELDSILNRKFSILNEQETIALQARLDMFKDPDQHQIATNQRTGDY